MIEAKFTPAYDNKIYQKYSKKTIVNKEKNKIAFLQDADLPYNKKVPLICITYPLIDKNNVGMLQEVMNGILEQPVELVVGGIGNEKFQQYFTQLAEHYPKKITIVPVDSVDAKRKVYAASDMIFVPAESSDCLEEAMNAMAYGVIPLVSPQAFAEDYDAIQEKGNAFVFSKGSAWSFFASFIRALENFRFPYDWKNIQVNAMES